MSACRPKHLKSFHRFIIEAIDEVAPAQGAATYWRAFDRWQAYTAERHVAEAKRDAKRTPKRDPADEWTIGDLLEDAP